MDTELITYERLENTKTENRRLENILIALKEDNNQVTVDTLELQTELGDTQKLRSLILGMPKSNKELRIFEDEILKELNKKEYVIKSIYNIITGFTQPSCKSWSI